jgi:hypothetical protein
MIQIPAHLQGDFDALSPAQQQKLVEMAQWGAAGSPGNLIITDMAFERCLKVVKQMGAEPVEPIEPDRTVNHDWPQNLIPKK